MKALSQKSSGLLLLLAATSGACLAQQAATSDAAPSTESDRLVEIVVTAQKRAENLQDVPIAISTITSADLNRNSINNGYDIQTLVPSLIMTTSGGAVTPFIRGVGTFVTTAGEESSNAMYIDGVYLARVNGATLELNNIDQIEVLKGPQGTLFGRNASGGAINITTRTPTQTPELEASVGYANYDTVTGSLYAAGGVGEKVEASISFMYRDQVDGWGHSIITGDKDYYDDYKSVRSKWILHATDTTKITLSGDVLKSFNDLSMYQSIYPGYTEGNGAAYPPHVYIPPSNVYDSLDGSPAVERDEEYGFSARVDQETSLANLVSITAYRKGYGLGHFDTDYGPYDWFYAHLDNHYNQFSQELQVVSKPGSPITWIGGAYFFRSVDGYYPTLLLGQEFGGAEAAIYAQQVTKSKAVFSQATAPIASDTKLTLGLRYTEDDVTGGGITNVQLPNGTVLFPGTYQQESSSFDKVTWRAALDHKFTEDILAYVSDSRGYKAGVYSTLPIAFPVVKPEVLDAYEAGVKTEFLDHRLRVNASGYFYDIKDLQVDIYPGASVVLLNAPKAQVKGVDVDAAASITSRFTVQLGASFLRARYIDFPDAPAISAPDRLVDGMVPGCSTPAVLPTPGNGGNVGSFCSINASGNTMTRAPTFSGDIVLNYSVPLPYGKLDATVSETYKSGFYWDADNFNRQGGYGTLGASALYTLPDGKYWVRLWGKNLTDKAVFVGEAEEAAPYGDVGAPGAPRTYGITLGVKL
jgi:iron complex outermembrane receptor protein